MKPFLFSMASVLIDNITILKLIKKLARKICRKRPFWDIRYRALYIVKTTDGSMLFRTQQ